MIPTVSVRGGKDPTGLLSGEFPNSVRLDFCSCTFLLCTLVRFPMMELQRELSTHHEVIHLSFHAFFVILLASDAGFFGGAPTMANKRRVEIKDPDLQGLKYFKILKPLLERLHNNAAARDRADNRRLFFDQYACLVLLYFFNPIVTSLRSIQ